MKSIRHVTLSQTVETRKTAGSGNPPQIYFPMGVVSIPKNFVFEIKNFNISVSDLEVVGSGNSFDAFVLYHRFFLSDDPIQDLINQKPATYSLDFNGGAYSPGSFQRNDIKDSSGTFYNRVLMKNLDPGTHTQLETIDFTVNTIHECIPFTLNNIPVEEKDFYFESRFSNFLAFCIFPFLTFNVPSGSLVCAFDYSINFDLIQVD